MTEEEREQYLTAMDEDLLKGSVSPSAWSTFLIIESDTAFIKGAHLAAIITAVSGMETQLRFEYCQPGQKALRLAQLIDSSDLPMELKRDLHELRRYRNRWVHLADPWDASSVPDIEDDPLKFQAELEPMALRAVTVLRKLFYWNHGT